jgi:hypothetical protein
MKDKIDWNHSLSVLNQMESHYWIGYWYSKESIMINEEF